VGYLASPARYYYALRHALHAVLPAHAAMASGTRPAEQSVFVVRWEVSSTIQDFDMDVLDDGGPPMDGMVR
jgi:hypothetical protein